MNIFNINKLISIFHFLCYVLTLLSILPIISHFPYFTQRHILNKITDLFNPVFAAQQTSLEHFVIPLFFIIFQLIFMQNKEIIIYKHTHQCQHNIKTTQWDREESSGWRILCLCGIRQCGFISIISSEYPSLKQIE